MTLAGQSYQAANCLENKYLYNGKELQNHSFSDGSSLDWYDYGKRFYDAVLGRWHSLDPMNQFASGYIYCANNPIIYIDPNGMFATEEEAQEYAKANGIRTGWFSRSKIVQNSDGTWSIDNKKAGSSIFNDPEFGITNAALVTADNIPEGNTGSEWIGDGSSKCRWQNDNHVRYYSSPWDERGLEIFGRWFNGSGEEVKLLNGKWGEYMKANDKLQEQIIDILINDAAKRTQEGKIDYQGSAEIENNYVNGYGLLHGTYKYAGGFQIHGNVKSIGANVLEYRIRVSWHDIIDANSKYPWEKEFADFLKLIYGAEDYKIHIFWDDVYTIQK